MNQAPSLCGNYIHTRLLNPSKCELLHPHTQCWGCGPTHSHHPLFFFLGGGVPHNSTQEVWGPRPALPPPSLNNARSQSPSSSHNGRPLGDGGGHRRILSSPAPPPEQELPAPPISAAGSPVFQFLLLGRVVVLSGEREKCTRTHGGTDGDSQVLSVVVGAMPHAQHGAERGHCP